MSDTNMEGTEGTNLEGAFGGKKGLYWALGVLAVLALVLGYFALTGGLGDSNNVTRDNNNNQNQETVTLDGDMTPEEIVFNFPSPEASDEVKRAHAEAVNTLAVESDVLDITGCSPEPLVLLLTEDQSITIRNDDPTSHTITFGVSQVVPANSSEEVVLDFVQGPGYYGYGCDDSGGVVGMFLVVGSGARPDQQFSS